MAKFIIQLREGVRFDDDGFTVDSGRPVRDLGTLEADRPAAARKPAEKMLRDLGIAWNGYVSGEWSCGWHTGLGVVTLTLESE